MKWYCIRPRCLPADQVKDMLVPEKSGSAPEMEGVSELPDGFREATITCLEFINEVSCSEVGRSGAGLPVTKLSSFLCEAPRSTSFLTALLLS